MMQDLFIYLLVMVVVVPLSKLIGFGSVIGYLVAGVIIGPEGLALLNHDAESASKIAEFGVIMMLLLIGLELNPKLLWKMRGPIFGLGSLQMVGTIGLFALGLSALHMSWQGAVAIGMIVSVSSTAIVLQSLQEQGYAKSAGGERSLSVLLFQDMAVIPILALLPLLGGSVQTDSANAVSPLAQTGRVFLAVVGLVVAGRVLIRPLFQLVARTKLREIFTALALLIVLTATAIMHAVGVSPALGAFLAGVVLADSEFRHQIEADLEPFKGLLLGLFFITIGSNIEFTLIMQKPAVVAAWVGSIILLKALWVYALGRFTKLRAPESLLFAVALAQGGEFAFVLINQSAGILSAETTQILTAAIAISMAFAPILIKLTIAKGMSRLECVTNEVRAPDTVEESERDNPVLVIGIGRFGQTLIRFLRANGFRSTVLDIDSEQIDIMARFGIQSYFGDGANLDLLRAAGLERAKALVVAVDEAETAVKIVEQVRHAYPKMPIYSRAYDRIHAYKLLHLGVTEVAVETSGSALALGTEVIKQLGVRAESAEAKARLFQVNNQRSIRDLSKRFHLEDTETFIQSARQMSEQLDAMLRSDPTELAQGASSDWVPPSQAGAVPQTTV